MESAIRAEIEKVLEELGVGQVTFSVEHPADVSHGDYSTNVAMVICGAVKQRFLSRELRIDEGQHFEAKNIANKEFSFKNPNELAKKFKEVLEGKISQVTKIDIAGPGFINFHLDRNFFSEKIAEIGSAGDTWGKNDSRKGKKIVVEYTDPNPFKEFHIGHLFTNSVGESIVRLFIESGAEVRRVNYQGDVGLHVAYALWGMQKLGLDVAKDFTARDLGRAYALGATAYAEGSVAQGEIRDINKKVYDRSDESINGLYDKGREVSLAYFETIYKIVDTEFDEYFFESETGPRGKELVERNPDIFTESDGARIFEGEKYGLHTRVFLNKEGLPTYEAKELALAKVKEERLGKYDLSVIVTANEISEYFKVLKKAMSFVYPELEKKTEHIGHGLVRLSTGKMSSRTGDVIPAIDFIDEVADSVMVKMDAGGKVAPSELLARDVAIGAIKYATLRGNILQDSVFDKEKALSFEGDSGPYLMYTHARIASILDKAKEENLVLNTEVVPAEPYGVEKIVYQFPEVIAKAQKERAPHHIVTYLTQLAGAFNTFYAQEQIVNKDDSYTPYKIAVASAVKTTLKNGLWVLGIKAPERM